MNILENHQRIRELEKATNRFLVEVFQSDADMSNNTIGVRAAVFTDHDEYHIKIDYVLNGVEHTLYIEIPFWSIVDNQELVRVIRDKIIWDLSSKITEQVFMTHFNSLNVNEARLKAHAKFTEDENKKLKEKYALKR